MKKVICNDARSISPSLKEDIYEKIDQHGGEGVDEFEIYVSSNGNYVYLYLRDYSSDRASVCYHTWRVKREGRFYIQEY